MTLLEDFKKFALKGNMIDLAIGVIIGAAFGKVIGTLVDNILTPPLGLLIGGVDFARLRFVLKSAPEEVAINYGVFIQALVNFFIVAGALFLLVTMIRTLHRKSPESTTPEEVLLLRQIRDQLKK
jgi:large conductance mechanosensitive channel